MAASIVARPRALRLLVVDDDPVARLVLARVLSRLGHETSTAATVATGVELALTGRPDVVFCDVHLPDGNAIDLLSAVRALGLSMPFVSVTGVSEAADSRDRSLGRAAGLEPADFAATLTKPVDSRSAAACLRGLFDAAAPAERIRTSPERPSPAGPRSPRLDPSALIVAPPWRRHLAPA